MVLTGVASNNGWEMSFKDVLYYIRLGTGWEWGGAFVNAAMNFRVS